MDSKQNNLKAKSIVYQSKRSQLSQIQVNELLNAKITMAQDYFVEDKEHWEDQNGQINLKEEIISANQTFTKRCVGRIVSKFPKKQRISKDNHQTDKEIVTSGTASYIGQNLLLTAAHNIFLREHNQMASQVYFIPEICNKQENPQSLIPALKYAVLDEYAKKQNQYSQRYDIALVQLQDNKFENQTRWFEIQWSYKRWNQTNKNLNLLGYPTSKKNNNTYSIAQQQKYIRQQNQFICYLDSQQGQSGGPLLKIIDKQNQESVKIVGLHKGRRGLNSLGLTLNTNQNTQEILFQLAQQLQVEEKLNSYEISHKKLRELTKQDNIVKKQKQVNVLKKKNKQLEKQVEKLKCKISLLQAKIEQLQTIDKNNNTQFLLNQRIQDKIYQTQSENLYQKSIKIEQKLKLELYGHFQNRLRSNIWHYNKKSTYYLIKQLEKEDIESQIVRFLNNFDFLKQNQICHYEQLLNLIEIYNREPLELITNRYHISNFNGPAKFELVFKSDQPFDLTKFVTFDNWHHIARLSLTCGKWFDCDSWRILVKHASNFKYLKKLELKSTNIKQINEGDIQTFQFLEEIRLWMSPLSKETKQILERLEETTNIMVDFDR